MSKGYVYVLSNPSMPGLVKVGRSIHGGKQRASQLNHTGTPTPFVLEFEMMSKRSEDFEHLVHTRLAAFRPNDNREFFCCSVSLAVERIVTCFIEMHAKGLELVEVDPVKGKRRPFPQPEPTRIPSPEERARSIAALRELADSLNTEASR